jgi:hypothetical protein
VAGAVRKRETKMNMTLNQYIVLLMYRVYTKTDF